ncbi:MAG: prepilin-type N-terminal cleavage/methylation domain-containing protein [Gammaproteobacteria bacterium]|nr:prepilin-type N-terminal cleavage/methylation domain-containing protein [Gammaproteobacteria bacterium]
MLTANNNGYTILELLMTMVVAVILLGVAVPGLQGFIKNNRMLGQTNVLMIIIKSARSEAVTQRTNLSVCRTSDNINCTGTGNNYIAFTDTGVANKVDGTDSIIKQIMVDIDQLTFSYDGGSSIRFNSRGSVGTKSTITICDDRGDDYRRGITISPIGRSKTAEGGELASCS